MIFSHCVYLACGVCLSNSAQAWTTSHCILLFRKPVCCWISMWKVKCTFKNAKVDVQGKTYVHTHTHTCICIYMKMTHQESCEILLVGTESSHTQTQWKFIKECPNACANGGKSYAKYHDWVLKWIILKMAFFSDQWELRSQFLICWLTVSWFKKCS